MPPDVIEAHLTALNMKGGDWVNPLQKKLSKLISSLQCVGDVLWSPTQTG